MKLNANTANALWDAFIARWPLNTLNALTLEEYTQVKGGKAGGDSFTYWLESKTEEVGSIWGGSAFKFGIYHRNNSEPKEGGRGRIYTDSYAWYEQYGSSTEEAFLAVRNEVVKVATAARAGELHVVEQARLGPAIKWKIAFLYQDRDKPTIIPIFKLEILQAVTGMKGGQYPELYSKLMADRNGEDIFAYAAHLWEKGIDLTAKHIKLEDALEFLKSRFSLYKESVKYMAGFDTEVGRQMGLVLRGGEVNLFVQPGDWESLVPGVVLKKVTRSMNPESVVCRQTRRSCGWAFQRKKSISPRWRSLRHFVMFTMTGPPLLTKKQNRL